MSDRVPPGTKLLEVTRLSAADFERIDETLKNVALDFYKEHGSETKLENTLFFEKALAALKWKPNRLMIGIKTRQYFQNCRTRTLTDPLAIINGLEIMELLVFRAPQLNDRIAYMMVGRCKTGRIEMDKLWMGNLTLPELLK